METNLCTRNLKSPETVKGFLKVYCAESFTKIQAPHSFAIKYIGLEIQYVNLTSYFYWIVFSVQSSNYSIKPPLSVEICLVTRT